MPSFDDLKQAFEQKLEDIDRRLSDFVEPFSEPIEASTDPSMLTGAGHRSLSRSFLDDHRIPSRPKHYQLTADEAFPIDLPEDYAGRSRYYVPVSIKKMLARQTQAKSLADSIVAAVLGQSGDRDRVKYEAIKALLEGGGITRMTETRANARCS